MSSVSAAFSATMYTALAMKKPGMRGNTEASTTRNPLVPWTSRRLLSTPPDCRGPMAQLHEAWCPHAFRRTNSLRSRQIVPAAAEQPDPRMIRRILRQRQQRARFFDGDLFADPAWDMLLDLTAARGEDKRVSVTSLCIAAGVPPTTALRWIGQMRHAGLFERIEDKSDRRRAFIGLTEKAADGMARFFAAVLPQGVKAEALPI